MYRGCIERPLWYKGCVRRGKEEEGMREGYALCIRGIKGYIKGI